MPITQKFSVMCDEVRIENNGKIMVIGMYTPNMTVFQLPYVAATLTFLLWLESDRPGLFQFNAKITNLESGQIVVQAMGGAQFHTVGSGIAPIRFVGVQFTSAGGYTFSVAFEGQEPIITTFSVILAVPVTPGAPGFPGLPGIPGPSRLGP